MTTFYYKGRSPNGNPLDGHIEAVSPDAAAGQLIERGITPIDINEKSEKQDDVMLIFRKYFGEKKPKADDLIMFSRQMYTLTKAGVPLTKAINSVMESVESRSLQQALIDIVAALDGGRELSTAMRQHPKVFNILITSMVEVGENTGEIDGAFLRIAKQLEREKHTRSQIKSALRYPSFVVMAMIAAFSVINIFVIPKFVGIFSRAKVELPIFTKILMVTSELTTSYWHFTLAMLIITIIMLRQYLKTDKGKFNWDRLKLRIPIIGPIIFQATLARFLSSFSMAMSAGVPLVQALSVVAKTEDNSFFADRVLNMRAGVERGEPITRTAIASGVFTPIALQMLTVGEESGNVDTMLLEVAEYYDSEVDVKIKSLSSAIEPILIVFMGIIVLILALGVFLPMWDMSKTALKH